MKRELVRTARGNTVYTKKYNTFLGVDFSKEAMLTDERRSPDAVNLISDIDGFPEKRVGWRVLKALPGRINGIFTFGKEDSRETIVHAGDKIYKLAEDEPTEIYAGCADSRSCGKYFQGKLCILTGKEYLVYDGETCKKASEHTDMYAPITHIQRETLGVGRYLFWHDTTFSYWHETGNFGSVSLGTVPEGMYVNLLSGKRKNTFSISDTEGFPLFVLDGKIDKGTKVTMRCISTGTEIFSVTYNGDGEILNGVEELDGIDYERWVSARQSEIDISFITPMQQSMGLGGEKCFITIGNSEKQNCGFVICQPNIQAIEGYEKIDGIDDFSIELTHTVEGYADKINKCRFMDVFENRVFFSGNPDYPNVDWYSGVNDPLFIPDINYTEIGLDSSRIMGYLRSGSEQAIVKNDGDGATLYMRSYSTLSDGSVIFPVRQGISGLGAVSETAMCTFLDDPVYLTRNGVYAIGLQDVSSERCLNLRSTRVNGKLLYEENLKNAVMCEWEGYLLVCVNGRSYVADAAQKSYSGNKTGTFEYEWYYWTNIPARVFGSVGDTLYFGTEDGKLCRFNTDMRNSKGELSSKAYSDNGEAVCARWATPFSDDGDFMQLKTMLKKGSGVLLKTYNRSGVSVWIRTESRPLQEVTSRSAGIFNFEDLDFSDFTFNTDPYTVVPFNSRIKKYKAIQIVCKNEKVNQAFGVGGIIRRYAYVKKEK